MRTARRSSSSARVVKVGPAAPAGAVVVDVPLDAQVIAPAARERPASRLENVYDTRRRRRPATRVNEHARTGRTARVLFERSLAQLDVSDWEYRGDAAATPRSLTYRLRELYQPPVERAVAARAGQHEAVGRAAGRARARSASCSSSSRRSRWSWAWRWRARSPARSTSCSWAPSASARATSRTASTSSRRDQLGELADSFNQMTGSIEDLLQTAAEKKRLEEELRIARQIQMSLLPRGPLDFPGIGVTALCVPGARSRRGLLRLLPRRRPPARRADRRRRRERARPPRCTWRS